MASVEEGRLSEEPLPENKRHGEGCESEEEPKPQNGEGEDEDQIRDEDENDDYDDHEADFYEGDSDYDKDDDFYSKHFVDRGYWWDGDQYAGYLDTIENKEDRGCLHKSVCNMYQHRSEFRGSLLFELFKVKLKLNDKVNTKPLKGEFCGAIEYCPQLVKLPDSSVRISYYWVSEKDPDFISLDSVNNTTLLPLSGPETRPPIFDCDLVDLTFSFKFDHKDVFDYRHTYENLELFDDGSGNHTAKCWYITASTVFMQSTRTDRGAPYIKRQLIGRPSVDPILFYPYYIIYYGAWATVLVEIVKNGVSSCSGSIYARPCVYRSRIRLLSVQSDQKLNIGGSGYVELTRSVVAVPSYASLVIAAVLNDQDGEQIVRGKTFFPATEKGIATKYIQGNDGLPNLKITVEWTCKP